MVLDYFMPFFLKKFIDGIGSAIMTDPNARTSTVKIIHEPSPKDDFYKAITDQLANGSHYRPSMDDYSKNAYDLVNSKRAYDAAIPTGTTADWLAWATSGSYEVLNAWKRITYLARDLERNNPHAIAFLRDLCTNVIGEKGIRMKPKVKNEKGDNLNTKLNQKISDIWESWNKVGNCDVTEQYSGNMADRLILRALFRDGGCLIRMYPGFANKHKFAIQLLEIDALDLWYNVILDDQNRVTTGVEVNKFGKPIAYHLIQYAQADLMSNNTVGKRERVPADQIIHVWIPNRITEVRGISSFAPCMVKMRMLDKFEEAVAIAQRITASKMGFFERELGSAEYKGQGTAATGEVIEEVTPGQMISLPQGYSFKQFDPGNPTESYKDFKKDMLRTICAALGDQYNAIANDLEAVNYSSARFGRDIAVEHWRMIQRYYIDYVKQRLCNKLIECSVLNGDLDIPFADGRMEKVQSSMEWRPRGWENVDPVKDTQGSIAKISFGLSTRSDELANVGLDFEEVCEKLDHEDSIARKYGLTFIDPASRNPLLSTQEDPNAGPGNVDPQATEAAPAAPAKIPGGKVIPKPVAKPVAAVAKKPAKK